MNRLPIGAAKSDPEWRSLWSGWWEKDCYVNTSGWKECSSYGAFCPQVFPRLALSIHQTRQGIPGFCSGYWMFYHWGNSIFFSMLPFFRVTLPKEGGVSCSPIPSRPSLVSPLNAAHFFPPFRWRQLKQRSRHQLLILLGLTRRPSHQLIYVCNTIHILNALITSAFLLLTWMHRCIP